MSTPNRQEYGESVSSIECSYLIWKDTEKDNRYYARNGKTGINDFQSTDAATVIQSAWNASGVNYVYLKNGVYPISSPLVGVSQTILKGVSMADSTTTGTVLQASGAITNVIDMREKTKFGIYNLTI